LAPTDNKKIKNNLIPILFFYLLPINNEDNYKFPKFIELDTRYGLNYQQQQTIQTTSNQSTNASLIGGGYGYYWAGAFVDDYTGEIDNYNDKRTFQNWLSKATLTFDLAKDFNMNVPLKFTTLAAYDYRKNVDNYYTTYGQSLPLDPPFTFWAPRKIALAANRGPPCSER